MHAKRKSNDGGVKPSSRAILALSLILNVILIIVVAAAGVYKFTGIRYVLGGGGGTPMRVTIGTNLSFRRLAT